MLSRLYPYQKKKEIEYNVKYSPLYCTNIKQAAVRHKATANFFTI